MMMMMMIIIIIIIIIAIIITIIITIIHLSANELSPGGSGCYACTLILNRDTINMN